MRRSLRRTAAIAAAFAIVLQALWPLLSHARPKDPTLQVPLCSVDGTVHVQEIKVGKTTPLDERASSHGDHCKLCVFGDGKDVVLAEKDVSSFTPEHRSNQHSGSSKAFFLQETLNSARPRAPPAVS